MGTIVGVVANALITKAAADGAQKLSVTKLGMQVAAAATAPAWLGWIEPALAGDWAARGQLFGLALGYVLALWGRWRAEK